MNGFIRYKIINAIYIHSSSYKHFLLLYGIFFFCSLTWIQVEDDSFCSFDFSCCWDFVFFLSVVPFSERQFSKQKLKFPGQ